MFKMPIIPDTLYDIDDQVQDDNVSEDTATNIILEVPNKEIALPNTKIDSNNFNIKTSINNLQEAMVWTEILGKPMCKRRRKRYNG
ncbi:MAG TPA: hypothetical protein GXZ21_05110 [Clostridiales bacterium]|nr:hypothetical protein [Clostridiales bacterium]